MSEQLTDEQRLNEAKANPFFAINISENLFIEHEPMISKEGWVRINAKAIAEMGVEEWLNMLLKVLETGGPDLPGKE